MDKKMPSYSLEEWEEIVYEFFKKYSGIKQKQDSWVKEVYKTGKIINPTGRQFQFLKQKREDGSVGYSRTQIVNYPVQSLATADIVPLAMVVANKRIRQRGLRTLFINQVHDSLIYDCPREEVEPVARIVLDVMNSLPTLIERHFGFPFNVPLTGDAKAGESWGTMKKLVLT